MWADLGILLSFCFFEQRMKNVTGPPHPFLQKHMSVRSFESTTNGSTTPLSASGTFTGTAVEVTLYKCVMVTCYTDQDGILEIQFGPDGTNWDSRETFVVRARTPLDRTVRKKGRYCRVKYANGPADQAVFRLCTVVETNTPFTSDPIHTRPAAAISDTMGRQKVVQSETQFTVDFTTCLDDLGTTKLLVGSGNTVHDGDESLMVMSVSNASDGVTVQTFRRGIIQMGKTVTASIVGVANADSNADGVTTDMGYFDADDGAFFRHENGAMNVVLRTSRSGAAVDTVIPQASWNLDPVNGTGASGIDADWEALHVFTIEMEWGSAARVQMGLMLDGCVVYVHQFVTSNRPVDESLSRASLPIRLCMHSTTGAGKSKFVGGAVIQNGRFDMFGRQFGFGAYSGEGKRVNTTFAPIMSIRLRPNEATGMHRKFRKHTAVPLNFEIHSTSSANVVYKLVVFRGVSDPSALFADPGGNPNQTGYVAPSFQVHDDKSSLMVDVACANPDMAEDGVTVVTGFMSNNTDMSKLDLRQSNLFVGADVSGDADILTLFASTLGGNETIYAIANWLEFS